MYIYIPGFFSLTSPISPRISLRSENKSAMSSSVFTLSIDAGFDDDDDVVAFIDVDDVFEDKLTGFGFIIGC